MLKIKDDVDLKELEKFGFEIKKHWMFEDENYCKDVSPHIVILVELDTRKIFAEFRGICEELKEEYIQDLIQAGLVEKVDDEK